MVEVAIEVEMICIVVIKKNCSDRSPNHFISFFKLGIYN